MTDDELRRALVMAADQSAPCHRVLRYYENRQVAVRPADFYQALKAVDEAVVRIENDGVASIDCRHDENGIEFATDLYDGEADRNEFLDKVSSADAVEVRHQGNSEFAASDDGDHEVRADGGTSIGESGRPGGAGKCPQGCRHPVAGRDTLETCEETVPVDPPEVFEVYGETVVQTERVRRYTECIVCGWVIDI